MTPESFIRNQICSYISRLGIWFTLHDSVGIYDPTRKVFRSNKNPYRLKGCPDISAILPGGRALWIEVKTKGSYPTREQKLRIAEINQQGGLAFVARSIEDVKNEFRVCGLLEPK